MVVGEDTLLVEREDSWDVELSIDNTVSKHFLHHFLLTGFTIGTSNEVALFDIRDWLAFVIGAARLTLGFSQVWGTFLVNEVTILTKETVEEGPATITTLVHVVALHEVLGRECWNIYSIFQLESGFNDLSEGNSVARTAGSLVSDRTCEVETINVSEVKGLWNFCVGDVISSLIFLGITLYFIQYLLELRRFVTKDRFWLFNLLNFSFNRGVCSFGLSGSVNLSSNSLILAQLSKL